MENSFQKYQRKAHETALGYAREDLWYCVLGLCGESGELAEKVKKIYRDHGGVVTSATLREALIYELGDILWYLAITAKKLNIDLSDVAALNLEKLASRMARDKLQGSGDNR